MNEGAFELGREFHMVLGAGSPYGESDRGFLLNGSGSRGTASLTTIRKRDCTPTGSLKKPDVDGLHNRMVLKLKLRAGSGIAGIDQKPTN
jgi:hypothetical protein